MKKIGHSWTARKPSFVSGKCPYIVTSHSTCTRRVPPAGLCDCSKCDSSGFDLDSRNSSWSIARLKENLRKKEDTVVCCSRKPSFLNAKYLSIVISHTHCVACAPRCFPSGTWNKKKKKKPPGKNFACIATSSPCFLPASDSEWPQDLAQTTVGANRSLSLRLRTLTWDRGGRKENTDGTAPAFGKCLALLGFKELVMEESTCRLLGTSMTANIFLREDVPIAYDRAIGNAEVRPVSLTNGKQPVNQRFLSSLDREKPWEKMGGRSSKAKTNDARFSSRTSKEAIGKTPWCAQNST